jgi:hypothetical protein
MKPTLILSIATLAIVAVSPATAQTPRSGGSAANAGAPVSAEPSIIILVQKPTYPFTSDIASGKMLPAKPIEYVKDGTLFRLADESSKAAVDANVTAFKKKIADAVIVQQKPTYPLTTSALSGKKLETTAVDHVFGTRLIRLADAAEVTTFEADPNVTIRKLNDAYIQLQLPTYPYKQDPVNNEVLATFIAAGKTPVKYLWGNKLILFTSADSVPKFETTPETFLTLLESMK